MRSPVFIIGTERSGSNLLRLILDAHPGIVVPHPPHILRYFGGLEGRYGELADDPRFAVLVADVLALVAVHIHPWPWIPAAPEVIRRARQRSLFGVYVAIHEALADHVGKPRWGCKSTFMVDHVAEVRASFPDARFLWLYRDPRDVAASSRESVFSAFAPAFSARLWVKQQEKALAAEAGGGVLRVPYEALVADPEAVVRGICAFLDEPFEPGMLRWFDREEAGRSASLSESWKNTAAPMQKDRLARYRRDLSPEEVATVEEIAAPLMKTLGYGLDCPPRAPLVGAAGWWREWRWRLLDDWLWLNVEIRSARRDRNVGRRRARWWTMQKIRWRLVFRGR